MRQFALHWRRLLEISSPLLVLLAGCAITKSNQPLAEGLTPHELSKIVAPSHHRNWEPSLAVLPYIEWSRNSMTVRNIRNCDYIDEGDYVVRYYDKTFDLSKLDRVDFIVVPFKEAPSLAHTMLSFGFGDQGHLAVSAEVRLEDGESYSPVKGAMRQYELMYVLADERDVLLLRTKHRDVDVYLYPTRATPQQARLLLVDVMTRVNQLAVQPEFYDTFTNNCTTNIVNHINRLYPGRVPLDIGVLLPGYADQLAYDLGLLHDEGSFERTRQRAHINRVANRHAESPDFSEEIRRR
jgi:hypothetical protein